MAISAILIAMVFSGANIPYPGHNPTDKLIIGNGNGHKGIGKGHLGSNSGGNHTSITSPNFTLSGNIYNLFNKMPVNGTVVISNSTMSRTLNTNANGSYRVTLPRGSYSIGYSSPGFYNSSTSISLNRNTTQNTSISPLYSLGNGINEFSNKSSITANSPNASHLAPYLNDSALLGGLNTNNITGKLDKNITVELGKKLNNTRFLILLKQNGAVYDYTGITNSKGNGTLPLEYSGNYTMAAYTLYYNSSFVKYSTAKGIYHIKFNMTARETFNSTIMLNSSVPLNGNASTAKSYLNGTGGIFIINPTFIKINSTGTYFSYSMPSGIYRFNYNNRYYVPKNFNMNVAGNTSINKTINPYLISVNITDNTGKSYNYTLNGVNYSANGTYRVTAGEHTLYMNMSGKAVYSKSIMISATNPYYGLNLTIQNKNVTFGGTEFYGSSNLEITYQGNINSSMIITSLDFKNFTTNGTGGRITISDNYIGTLHANTYEYNLTTPFNVSSGNMIVKLVYSNDSKVTITGLMSVEIYGFNISASGNYIRE
jgi:hypothetical protein